MQEGDTQNLSDRQRRELDYHVGHAAKNRVLIDRPFSWDVFDRPARRWWNGYWQMYTWLCAQNLAGQRVLVVGCGFGDDAIRIAKLGAVVSAFDLSPDSLDIARAICQREKLEVDFKQMPSESLRYPDASFDMIVARDILHHVDIPATMRELERVARPGATFVVNEIYSHSVTDIVRRSGLVAKFIYPRMQRLIYGSSTPYITEDERKLSESDLKLITAPLEAPSMRKYFNFIVTRVIPERFELAAKLDRLLLRALGGLGAVLAGRVLFVARFRKPA
jgi:ubiquinone/menaquinone biosynthesis C-methylase UbiE